MNDSLIPIIEHWPCFPARLEWLHAKTKQDSGV